MLGWLVPHGRPMFRSIFATFLSQREIETIVKEMLSTSKGKQTDGYHSLFFLLHFPQAAAGEHCSLLSKEKVTQLCHQRKPEVRMERQYKLQITNFFFCYIYSLLCHVPFTYEKISVKSALSFLFAHQNQEKE